MVIESEALATWMRIADKPSFSPMAPVEQPKPYEKARRTYPTGSIDQRGRVRQASAVSRLVSRENLREAVLRWSTPRATPRCNSG